eukprot:gene2485-biopygen11493
MADEVAPVADAIPKGRLTGDNGTEDGKIPQSLRTCSDAKVRDLTVAAAAASIAVPVTGAPEGRPGGHWCRYVKKADAYILIHDVAAVVLLNVLVHVPRGLLAIIGSLNGESSAPDNISTGKQPISIIAEHQNTCH